MDLTPKIPADRQVINAYGDGGFRVSGRTFSGSVLLFPDRIEPWPVSNLGEMTLATLQPLLETQPAVELLLVGCGAVIAPVPTDLRMALRQHGMVVEALDTGAACRTYNVLMGEGRRVAAALIAIK